MLPVRVVPRTAPGNSAVRTVAAAHVGLARAVCLATHTAFAHVFPIARDVSAVRMGAAGSAASARSRYRAIRLAIASACRLARARNAVRTGAGIPAAPVLRVLRVRSGSASRLASRPVRANSAVLIAVEARAAPVRRALSVKRGGCAGQSVHLSASTSSAAPTGAEGAAGHVRRTTSAPRMESVSRAARVAWASTRVF